MKIDKRKYNDNSREWNNTKVEERKLALKVTCQKILKLQEPITFSHIAKTMKLLYEKNITLSAQTISQTNIYRSICNDILNIDDIPEKKRKIENTSRIELSNELHKKKILISQLTRENKILRERIQKSNIPENTFSEYSINTRIDKVSIEIINILINELIKLGDFYIDRNGLIRETDGKIFISNQILELFNIKKEA
ncbi:hypothetical protein [Arcobacter ellisii]|uniref:Uncharacterized protein n=1 Tax=Arcobacter ellisii TaxID=913109 RepID=A0A347UA12_9BACT|nr:hypothetical protein [Arcobacter ellisii]AXX95690.1 hypothetical protein AELL_2046 [Arcobacter ellisii]RXI31437.1 hypothetical protein CP962_04815 [Arcobacter ellisii]